MTAPVAEFEMILSEHRRRKETMVSPIFSLMSLVWLPDPVPRELGQILGRILIHFQSRLYLGPNYIRVIESITAVSSLI